MGPGVPWWVYSLTRDFFHLTPYREHNNIYKKRKQKKMNSDDHNIQFIWLSFHLFGLGNKCTNFTNTVTGGGGGGGCDNKGRYPLFSGGYWRLGKHVRYINHTPLFLNFSGSFWNIPVSREIGLKTPTFSGFSRENFPETNGQKKYTLFSRKSGNTHATVP